MVNRWRQIIDVLMERQESYVKKYPAYYDGGAMPVAIRYVPSTGTGVNLPAFDFYTIPTGKYFVIVHGVIINLMGASNSFVEMVPEGFPEVPFNNGPNQKIAGMPFMGAQTLGANGISYLARTVIVPERSKLRLNTGQSSITANGYVVMLWGMMYMNDVPFKLF